LGYHSTGRTTGQRRERQTVRRGDRGRRSMSAVTHGDVAFRAGATQEVRSDGSSFHWKAEMVGTRNGVEKRRLRWEKSFPRDMM
jgi:hypothetical protein